MIYPKRTLFKISVNFGDIPVDMLKITQILISLLLIISAASSQDLHLVSGKSEKTIKAGTYIQVQLPSANQDPCTNCPMNVMIGKLIGYENNELRLQVSSTREPITEDNLNVGYATKEYTFGRKAPVMAIPSDVILSITKVGKNKPNELHPLDGVAIVFTVLGIGSLASIPIADEQAGKLLAAGLIELGLAAVIGGVAKQKKFITSPHCPDQKENARMWVLN